MQQPATYQQTVLVSDTLAVRARLLGLGLPAELLQEAVAAWSRAHAGTSPFEPPTAPGTKGWFAAVGVLRESKVTAGWRAKNIRNWPIVADRKTGIAITATSGDEYTGIPSETPQPSTKNRKGVVVETAVQIVNGEQLAFQGFGQDVQIKPERVSKKDRKKNKFITWFLLVFVTPDGARAELSLPAQISGKKIVRWHERIILEKFSRTPEPEIGTGGKDGDHGQLAPIDVPVERRA